MFKCTECGAKYDIKPDYCDCGNDTFIQEKEEQPKKSSHAKEQPIKTKPAAKPKIEHTKSTVSPKPAKNHKDYDIISLSILLTCVILSLCIIFFIGNPKEQTVQKDKTENSTVQIANIPSSVNGFWNNSTEGVVSDSSLVKPKAIEQPKQQTIQPEPPLIQKQIIYVHDAPSYTPAPKTQPQITTKQITPAKTQTKKQIKTQPKTNTTPKTSTTSNFQNMPQAPSYANSLTNKIKQNISTQTTKTSQPVQPQNKPFQTAQITKPQTNTKNTTTQNTTPKTTVLAPAPSTVVKVNTAAAKQELANYKISLRNTIGKKIDFTKVVGDGDCAITFKLDSNGKLINRAFSKQSSNITLNDAVYAAMMSTPSFSAPPSAYKNEILKLNVKFYNGNFTINLN